MAAIRKRLEFPDSFPIFPEYTMQAVFLNQFSPHPIDDPLLTAHHPFLHLQYSSCATVRTWDLYKAITGGFQYAHPAGPDVKLQWADSGKEFWYIEFDALRRLGARVCSHSLDGDRYVGEKFNL
jgi:hypothetical protein